MNKCCYALLNQIEEFIKKKTQGEEVKFEVDDWDCFKLRITGN
jgi:hypothetical protein